MTNNIKQYHNWLEGIITDGFGYVQITDNVPCNMIPKSFYELCLRFGLTPENMIQCIISDYMLRLEKGNTHYQNDVINRIINSNLKNKKEIIEVIYALHSKIDT